MPGAPGITSRPGARYGAACWIDSDGNLVLFGGKGYASTLVEGYLNDLWVYNLYFQRWYWISGSNTTNSITPTSARVYPQVWVDSQYNVWLFGGKGYPMNRENIPGGFILSQILNFKI